MTKYLMVLAVQVLAVTGSAAPLSLAYDFTNGKDHGWECLIRDVPLVIVEEIDRRISEGISLGPKGTDVDRDDLLKYKEEESHWLINFGISPLPKELRKGPLKTGYLSQGTNRSDDLDIWLVKRLEKLQPNTIYTVKMEVAFASNAQEGGFGVGGSEDGLAVYLGATARDPRERVVDNVSEPYLRFPKGLIKPEFNTGKSIANGLEYSETKPYKLVTVKNSAFNAKTNSKGELWLMVGTHSGFESFQAIYYTSLSVKLTSK